MPAPQKPGTPFGTDNFDIIKTMAKTIVSLKRRVEALESQEVISYTIKTTTGDPAAGRSGQIVENTVDNTLKMYADGGWRTIASGW